MFTNVNLSAPIGALTLLATGLLVLILAMTLIYALLRGKSALLKPTFLTLALFAGAYLGVMLIFSWTSSDRVLLRGQEKHFCEIDCHLAYSILDVRQTKSLGNPSNPLNAAGTFYVVTIKTRFDETTISSTRGDGPLYPNSRVLTVLDTNGQRYAPSFDAQRAVEQTSVPISTPLRPGESYTTTYVFDLPTTIRNPVLLMNEGSWITRFVIGHENSLAHKKTAFQI